MYVLEAYMINKQAFTNAIHDKKKVRLTFFSEKNGSYQTRICAPMDYAPSRASSDLTMKYHFWDFESKSSQHPLSLTADKIRSMDVLQETFEPSSFVRWSPNWSIKRDWGQYS
jgi:hypothetical protein